MKNEDASHEDNVDQPMKCVTINSIRVAWNPGSVVQILLCYNYLIYYE